MRKTAILTATLALAACARDPAPSAVPPPPPPERRLAATVGELEIGRTFDGFAIAATGAFPGRDWRRAGLEFVAAEEPGPDGLIDLALTAEVPPPDASPEGATRLRAFALLRAAQTRGARGVRVRGASGAVEKPFP